MYVAAVLGPGVLTLPALAAQRSGPIFLLALAALLVLSWPLATTFAALGRQFAGHGGIPAHVTRAFGPRAGRVVAMLFYLGVPPGVGALGLFAGAYLQAIVGGEHTRLGTAGGLVLLTWLLNRAGLRASAAVQVALTGILLLVVTMTLVLTLPHLDTDNFTPAAPHGWGTLAPATFLLVWVLTGWEASANLATALAPDSLRRVVVSAVAIVALAFLGLSIAMIGVVGVPDLGPAPVAQLLEVAVGPAAAVVGVGLALVLTVGNMNAYLASLAALGTTLPRARRVAGGPLTVPTVIALGSLVVTATADDAETLLVGVTAASQVPVLILALAAGYRLLPSGATRHGALLATFATSLLLVPAGRFLAAPALIILGTRVWEQTAAARTHESHPRAPARPRSAPVDERARHRPGTGGLRPSWARRRA